MLLLVVGKRVLRGRLLLNGGTVAIVVVVIITTILLTLILFLLGPLQYELHITGVFAPFHQNFQRVLVRGQQPFVVAPSLDEGESAGFPGGMGQGEYHVLVFTGVVIAVVVVVAHTKYPGLTEAHPAKGSHCERFPGS